MKTQARFHHTLLNLAVNRLAGVLVDRGTPFGEQLLQRFVAVADRLRPIARFRAQIVGIDVGVGQLHRHAVDHDIVVCLVLPIEQVGELNQLNFGIDAYLFEVGLYDLGRRGVDAKALENQKLEIEAVGVAGFGEQRLLARAGSRLKVLARSLL